MRYVLAHRPARQLELLAPPRQLPAWQALPAPIRDQTTAVRAQLRREHLRRPQRAAHGEETGDE